MKNRYIIFISFLGCVVIESTLAVEKQISSNVKQDTRIVSLSPATTEMLFDLQLGHLIVGTTQYSDYPKAAQKNQTHRPLSKAQLRNDLST